MPLRSCLSILAAGVAVAAAACSSDSPAAPPATSPVGVWHLRTVGGVAVPYDEGGGDAIASDQITLTSAGTYTEVEVEHLASSPDRVVQNSGTWMLQDSVTIAGRDSKAGAQWFGDWHGDTLSSVPPSGKRFVYTR